jgi:hypothetical protein
MSNIQLLSDHLAEAKSQLVKVAEPSSLPVMLRKEELVEMSVFGGKTATQADVDGLRGRLIGTFKDMSAIAISEICNVVLEEKWPISRINYAFKNMLHHEYRTFAPGVLLNQDKKITFGRSELALRRKLRFEITQNDIVVVKVGRTYTDSYGVEQRDWIRAFAYKEEAEDVMPERIVGRWNDEEHCFEYCGTIENHETDIRKSEFKKLLFQYCNKPPYKGEYDVDIVKQFFDYWSQTIPPGDMMKFETYMKFDIESALKKFNNKFNNQN